MAAIGAVVGLIGTAVSAIGTIAAGRAQKAQAEFQAQQYEVQAAEEKAAAQRQATEEGRTKRLAQSRVQALSAASGLGATDPSILDLTGELEQYGSFRQQMIQYGGESRSAALRDAAKGARATGKAAQQASYFDAGATILGGITNMYDKYGRAARGTPSLRYG